MIRCGAVTLDPRQQLLTDAASRASPRPEVAFIKEQ